MSDSALPFTVLSLNILRKDYANCWPEVSLDLKSATRLKPQRDIRESWLVMEEETVERIILMSASDVDHIGNTIYVY
jgi:hypothetical protein